METGTFNFKTFVKRHRSPLQIAMAATAGILTLLLLCGVAFYGAVTAGLPDVNKLDKYDPAQTTKIFARDGTMIATLFDQNRTPVTIDQVSTIMKQAMVAIEDRRFFEHEGVDLKGIARAATGNFRSGEVQQGASTLTMQLARRLFLDDEKSYTRKLREAVLAYRIDHTLSKDKILELYLNEVYFGSGAYGIDAAASLYFQVKPKDLNLWQSAMLAGLVQAPSAFSPLEDRKAALKRMDEVLAALESELTITPVLRKQAQEQAAAHKFKNYGLAPSDGMLKYPYFTTYVVKKLSEQFPENYIRRGGLQVYTTLDIPLQKAAEEALTQEVRGPGLQLGADNGAAVVIDNKSGEILALVGGTEWDTDSQFNRAWQAKRQPGSAFKMFVYAAALESGFHPEQEFADTEAVFNYDSPNAWKPSNSDGKFMGAIPMRSGLQFSRNLVAAKVTAHVGPSKVATLARQMGIEGELPQVISLALGAGETTPLEMARAYSVLPNGGMLKPNRVILKVTNPEGEILKDFSGDDIAGSRVLSHDTAMHLCEMLRRVVTGGTGTSANVSGAFIAGKTGTTDKFVDAWFVGFSPQHTISVWIGRDDNKPMGRVYGGTLPANVFRKIAEKAIAVHGTTAALPGVKFGEPVSVSLCWDSTYLALPTCSKTYTETFSAGIVPSRECPMHRQVKQQTVVVTKTPDEAVLTNLAEDEKFLAVPDGATTTQVATQTTTTSTTTASPISSAIDPELDPRQDPEVVTSTGAMIPYQEKAIKNEVKVLDIKIDKKYPSVDANTKGDSPTVDSSETAPGATQLDADGQLILLEENEVPSASEIVEEAQQQPQAYPTATTQPNLEPSRGESEVIYTNQQMEIPPDTVDD